MQEFAANCVVFASNSMPDLRRICIEFVVRQCDANSMQYLRRICIGLWAKYDAISMQFRRRVGIEVASKLHRSLPNFSAISVQL